MRSDDLIIIILLSIRYIVRSLQGKLRIGIGRHVQYSAVEGFS